MKTKIATFLLVSCSLSGWIATASARAKDLAELKILYVGSERASQYVDFLKNKVAQVEAKNRADFQLKDASSFDVVLLDWPQSEETREMSKLTSPLGARDEWNKPTVLLGSAGLNLAVAWKMKGGVGCTCMDPLAYDLRQHEIFLRPFEIDRGKMISITTPTDFKGEIETKEISVLPLVDNIKQERRPGWCTYALDFPQNPEVELFCGGVNHKTPTAAGLWRQGNLLHFGFEESPDEMNETGQLLLLNSIAYISRFSEDRPIAITLSPFAGDVALSRSTLKRWLRKSGYRTDWPDSYMAPKTVKKISELPSREKMTEWVTENVNFFHPNKDQKLEVDEELLTLGVSFDQPEFFDKTLTDLRSGNVDLVTRARLLLERYVPDAPHDGEVDACVKWCNENQPYLFASDAGDYRWYIDPLAKKRGVPSIELRGPKRADLSSPSGTANR